MATTANSKKREPKKREPLSPQVLAEIGIQRAVKARQSAVNHPAHYGGELDPYEAIKVIEAWDLGFHLGNTVKYISRAGKKDPAKEIQDLEKALWYLERKIKKLKKQL